MILTIIGVALIGVITSVIIRPIRPEFSVFISIAASLILLFYILDSFTDIITKLTSYIAGLGVNGQLFKYILKIVGISYILELVIDIAEECGASAIASKVSIAGKIIIAGMSLPILFDLLDLILGLI